MEGENQGRADERILDPGCRFHDTQQTPHSTKKPETRTQRLPIRTICERKTKLAGDYSKTSQPHRKGRERDTKAGVVAKKVVRK